MRIQKIAMCFLLAGCLTLMASCALPGKSAGEEKTEKTDKVSKEEVAYFSGELTEEEREGDYLVLDLMENLSVDADITSCLKYENGLNSYYVEERQDKKAASNLKSYQKNPEIAGKSLTEILEQLEEKSGGNFQTDKKKMHYYKGKKGNDGRLNISIPYQDKGNEKKMMLNLDQYFKQNKVPVGFELDFMRDYKLGEEAASSLYTVSETEIGRSMAENFPKYDTSDLSFANSEELAGELRELLEDIAGYELADKYECMPISRQNYQMVLSEGYYAAMDRQIVPIEGEFYSYFFYQQVDGFPWIGAGLTREDNSRGYSMLITASDEYEQSVTYGEDGIRELHISDSLQPGEIYQKVTPCSMDTVLEKIKEELGRNLILSTTVYGIEICYSGDFTEDNDEIVRPLWCVSYWNELTCKHLWLDAETGECIKNL